MKVKRPDAKQRWQPDPLQKVAVKYLLEHACAGLLLDPGAGKTAISYAAFKILKEEGLANRALVLAPKRVAQLTWPDEQKKWEDFSGLTVEFIHGADKEQRLWASTADIVVTNFDSLPWLYDITKTKHSRGFRVEVNRVRAKKLGFDTLIIDELSKLKHHSSGRHKIMKAVTDLFDRRWGLTGSVASNGLMGLFGQCIVLDEGRTFGRFITHYRAEYFDKQEYGRGYDLKPGAEEKIYERMAPLCLRLDETDQGVELPKIVTRVRHIELPPKARKAYDEIEGQLITQIQDKTVTAANAAVASGKVRQICSGAAYVEEDIQDILAKHKMPVPRGQKDWVHIHDEKIAALEELIEELEGQPMLIAYDFRFSLEKLQKKFGKDIAFIGGKTKDSDAELYKKQWFEGKLQLLFAHPQAVAHGLNLQEWGKSWPKHVCWYDPTWDYELYDQFIRRVRRRGNKQKQVYVHLILAKDTIDDKILAVLDGKRRTQNMLYDALRELTSHRVSMK